MLQIVLRATLIYAKTAPRSNASGMVNVAAITGAVPPASTYRERALSDRLTRI
jgi:hypothetical protein